MSGQIFRAPIGDDPAKTSFYGRDTFNNLLSTAYTTRVKENASYNLQRVVWEPGVWVDGGLVTGKTYYTWIQEPIEITPTKVKIKIRDDAHWSDGHQITGKDLACIPIQESLRKLFPPYYADVDVGSDKPSNIHAAFDDFNITPKRVTYTSSAGHFDNFWNIDIRMKLGTYIGPRLIPTHKEPYATYVDAVIETAKRAQAGEINPWKEFYDPQKHLDTPHKESLVGKHLDQPKYLTKFSKPENVLSTGAWDLVALDGKEFVFKPNQYHQQAEKINFETLRFEYTPSAMRKRAALKADRFDFSTIRGPPMPQTVVESLPDNIMELLVPGIQFSGNELALNFTHPALKNRAVRRAIMYVLDHKAISSNIHQSATPPVETPGGDCWDATEFVSQRWIDQNLISYTTNHDKAASLMREAGYTLKGRQWVGADGEPFTLTLPTPRDSPLWEPTVASQLSQFGIKTSVRTLSETVFSNRVDGGEFPIWPSSIPSTTNLAPYTLVIWKNAADNPEKYGIYPDEQFKTGRFSNGRPRPRTEDRYSVFTIKAPPIGKPEGSFTEYHPAASALFFWTNPPENEFRRRVKTGMWLANWFLPTIPITKKFQQVFIDEAHWLWPTDTPTWKSFIGGDPVLSGGVFSKGTIRANPDNPEKGAK